MWNTDERSGIIKCMCPRCLRDRNEGLYLDGIFIPEENMRMVVCSLCGINDVLMQRTMTDPAPIVMRAINLVVYINFHTLTGFIRSRRTL